MNCTNKDEENSVKNNSDKIFFRFFAKIFIMNILILGSGGREHAFASKLTQSKKLNNLFIAPGNAGTASIGTNVNISTQYPCFINDHRFVTHDGKVSPTSNTASHDSRY